jgi:hypothetical protein
VKSMKRNYAAGLYLRCQNHIQYHGASNDNYPHQP